MFQVMRAIFDKETEMNKLADDAEDDDEDESSGDTSDAAKTSDAANGADDIPVRVAALNHVTLPVETDLIVAYSRCCFATFACSVFSFLCHLLFYLRAVSTSLPRRWCFPIISSISFSVFFFLVFHIHIENVVN